MFWPLVELWTVFLVGVMALFRTGAGCDAVGMYVCSDSQTDTKTNSTNCETSNLKRGETKAEMDSLLDSGSRETRDVDRLKDSSVES